MDEFDAFLRTLGAWGYPLLGLAALIEYVFPPFPGDTVTVIGGAWAGREDRSVVLLHLVLTLGSVLGFTAMWRVGKSVGARTKDAADGSKIFGFDVEQVRKAQELMHRRSTSLLLLNRFLPSFRSVVFLAAGAADVSLVKTVTLGAVSAAVFNALLIFVGVTIGDNAEKLATFFSRFRTASFVLLGIIVLVFCARWLWRRRTS